MTNTGIMAKLYQKSECKWHDKCWLRCAEKIEINSSNCCRNIDEKLYDRFIGTACCWRGAVQGIGGHQMCYNHNNCSPSGVGVVGYLNHSVSSPGHVLGYYGDSRSSLDRLEVEGSASTIDVADLLRQGYAVSERIDEFWTFEQLN